MKKLRDIYLLLSKQFLRSLKVTGIFLINSYRVYLSSILGTGGNCRFYPSCSEYGRQAFEIYQPHRAIQLIVHRLLKCRPGGPSGYDPLPSSEGPNGVKN